MAYKEEDFLMISGIQHFEFCRRQWALIHIEMQWSENYLTADGRLMHERVHDESTSEFRRGILTIRGMQIKSERMGVCGTCDAVEFIPDEAGIGLHGRKGKWKPRPVEYKHGSPKVNDCDRLQLTAQVMCLEEMFCCQIDEAFLYYYQTRHRERVEITSELRQKTADMFLEMHNYYNLGYTPKVKKFKGCSSCSLADICLPQLLKQNEKQSVKAYVASHIEEVQD